MRKIGTHFSCRILTRVCVRELIIWGADIEVRDQDGRSALSVAVTCDSEAAAKLVTLLLDNGANPNMSDRDNMTPLLIAAFEGPSHSITICSKALLKGFQSVPKSSYDFPKSS